MAEAKGFVCLECGWEGGRSNLVRGDRGLSCPDCETRLF